MKKLIRMLWFLWFIAALLTTTLLLPFSVGSVLPHNCAERCQDKPMDHWQLGVAVILIIPLLITMLWCLVGAWKEFCKKVDKGVLK